MLSAILFDLDGTLVNTDSLHFQTWQEVLQQQNLSIDRPFYDQHISGRLNVEIVKDILPQLPLKEGLALAAAKEARFRELGKQLQRLAGLDKILSWSNKLGLKQAVVTNAPRENAEFMLRVLGLQEVFPVVILAEEAAEGKPHPAPYQLGLQRLGVAKEEGIAFEDSPSGVRSAVGAGLPTVGVATTHRPENLMAAGAEMVIVDFTESKLWQWLDNISG